MVPRIKGGVGHLGMIWRRRQSVKATEVARLRSREHEFVAQPEHMSEDVMIYVTADSERRMAILDHSMVSR